MLQFLMEHTTDIGPDSRLIPHGAAQLPATSLLGANGEPCSRPSAQISLIPLLHDKQMGNDAMVDNALSWLLLDEGLGSQKGYD
jgi:hypothetical protein